MENLNVSTIPTETGRNVANIRRMGNYPVMLNTSGIPKKTLRKGTTITQMGNCTHTLFIFIRKDNQQLA